MLRMNTTFARPSMEHVPNNNKQKGSNPSKKRICTQYHSEATLSDQSVQQTVHRSSISQQNQEL